MTALVIGWLWQLATTRKRHYFDGPESLCGKAGQTTDAKQWSKVPGQSLVAVCVPCLREYTEGEHE